MPRAEETPGTHIFHFTGDNICFHFFFSFNKSLLGARDYLKHVTQVITCDLVPSPLSGVLLSHPCSDKYMGVRRGEATVLDTPL